VIIYSNQKSKPKKKSKKVIEQYQQWLENINKQTTNFSKGRKVTIPAKKKKESFSVPPGRETPKYPSLNSKHHNTLKQNTLYYTGDKMIGIGTLHKSNAVPIFSEEEAKDQANMRR
jgi:hypothetical protein